MLGALNTAQAALPALRASKGRLVVVTSASGYVAYAGLATYSMSKFAVRAMVRQLVHEVSNYGVKITHVVPGPVRTNIMPGWNPPFSISQAEAASLIVEGVERGKRQVIFPARTRVEVFLGRHFPWLHAHLIRNAVLVPEESRLFRPIP